MAKFKVNLNRTSMENCTVEVEAADSDEAGDKAIDDFLGEHQWENQETIEISIAEVKRVDHA